MKFLVRVQNVRQLFAVVSNGVRLPWPGALSGRTAGAPMSCCK